VNPASCDWEEENHTCWEHDRWLNTTQFSALTTLYRVTSKNISDGNGHQYVYSYTYTGAAVNSNPPTTSYTEANSEFRGHATVTEIAPDGTKTINYFHQDDVLKGKIATTEVYIGNVLRRKTHHAYSATELPGMIVGAKKIPRYWVTNLNVENIIYNNDGVTFSGTKETYTYEPTYGNLTNTAERFWNGSGWTTYRNTTNSYWFNDTSNKYLVSLPGQTSVSDGAGNIIARNLYLYDGNTGSNQVAPANGVLTGIRTLVEGVNFSQISYGYDAWGNRTSETSYSGYGSANSNPVSGARTTNTTYDPVYHAYPTLITNALVQPVEITYDYAKGVPITEKDPNNAITSAEYDAFGRLIKLIRPGDTSSSPTITISYQDSFPFTTTLNQKIDASKLYTVQRIYDGIGRQTRIISGGSIVDTTYVSSTVTHQSMPYLAGQTAYNTITAIDLSTNSKTVTAPDGTVVSTVNNGLTTTSTDAKGNATTTTQDVWGRVAQVTPSTGPGITYSYDELGNMKTATRGGATTAITYDLAGRKLSMSDPDMGFWSYEYDALGNLIKQTDAKNQVVCLFYDNLNRLDGKTYPVNGSCGSPVNFNVDYSYDSGTNGTGRRTGMDDASGSTVWSYDPRGRVVSEVKTISGEPFSTVWQYNSADLPIAMTYPDNETLTYGYDNRMLPTTVNSSLGGMSYVSSSTYDAAGRMNTRALGNGLTQTYNYYAWNEKVNNVGQGGRPKTLTVGTLQSLGYSYDANGNIASIADSISGENQVFGYDTINRLISSTVTNGPAPYAESYSYNPTNGNLINNGAATLSYNDPAHIHAATNAGTNSYAYDANGNMTDRNVGGQNFDLAYDAENRLTS
ncbi:MAG: RHS repeat protein, partial [Flavobacteriales bacterium]|nr:RHS repeat protein [Flavobacteriales bacterium]